jgi:sulfur carrier protein
VNAIVNGEPRELPPGAKIADVLTMLDASPSQTGVAVAVNGEVVPRGRWSSRLIDEDDRVEVLNAIGGG